MLLQVVNRGGSLTGAPEARQLLRPAFSRSNNQGAFDSFGHGELWGAPRISEIRFQHKNHRRLAQANDG